MALIDGAILKGRQIMIPKVLQKQVLNQLHDNHMGIERNKTTSTWIHIWGRHKWWYKIPIKTLFSMSWISANAADGKINQCEVPGRPKKVVATDMFSPFNKNYPCIVHHHSKFPIIKMMEGLSVANLVLACKVVFLEYVLPKKIMLDAGDNIFIKNFAKHWIQSNQYHCPTTIKVTDR